MLLGNKTGYMVTGRITRDPELKEMENGNCKVFFSITYGKDPNGEKDERGRLPSLFMQVDVWGEYGRGCLWLKKGDSVLVSGRKDEHEYNGKIYKTLVADVVIPGAPETWYMAGKSAVETARNIAEATAAPGEALAELPAGEDDLPF